MNDEVNELMTSKVIKSLMKAKFAILEDFRENESNQSSIVKEQISLL